MKNKYFLFLLFGALLVNAQTTKKVLFLGNSYTQYNNLPSLVAQSATSTNDVLIHDSNLIGGYSLQQHATNQTSLTKINGNQWDYVVLQDQSQRPAFPINYVNNNVFPYAIQITNLIKQNYACSVPLFYTTWGKKNGDPQICQNGQCTYEVMDNLLQQRYRTMAETNKGVISPVSQVWRYIRENHPTIELYDSDNSHPSLAGSMAAAYTFYTVIYRKDPTLITFNSTLNTATATTIKNAVKNVVFNNLENYFVDLNDNFANFNSNLISGTNYQFNNTTANATNIVWNFGNGSTSNQQNPTHNFTNAGSYNVSLTLTVCGKSYTKTKEISITSLSNESFIKEQINLYPNPSSDFLNISVSDFDKIEIFDMLGKRILPKYQSTENGTQIDIQYLAKGNYILQISKGNTTEGLKFIKE
ncbi:T9SS C-terminal target domain-containing protein [Paenimyroides tangerinum]|uniref:T9SS C-terminal target domain-containing protein n=1 Tax=Paenimyroides tangerinum TaxID=2488728 RepID=A0A3P3WAD5_9FLAO|nr:T9SS type A sorting domain-containing protein [Paenimyroides tangerinum]RRJ91970.1 T9SS C-terminal target domain-containing protein [Paenimyroides tangerinum]